MHLTVFPHSDNIDAVFGTDIQLPDALAAPFGRRLQFGDAAVRRKFDKIQNTGRSQGLRQLDAGLTFRHDDMIRADLFQRAALRLVGGFTHNSLHA